VRIERIISKGHTSQENFWYDQDENEWVIVLKGAAKIVFNDDQEAVVLNSGDYINIPKHTQHRVDWTEPDVDTIWLAVFY
jgi:cupin 2 domain-containing protein